MEVQTARRPRPADVDSGLAALAQVARHHSINIDPVQLRHDLGLGGRRTRGRDLVRAAHMCGLKGRALSGQDAAKLHALPVPALLGLKMGGFVVLRRSPKGLALYEPTSRKARQVSSDKIAEIWSGEIILLRRDSTVEAESFGFSWFVKSIGRYKGSIVHVIIMSIFIQSFALATPLLLQVVIDKALVHRSISTLVVIACAMITVGTFDVLLQYLRSYALSHTSSRVDVELGAKLFQRLLRLPLSYFETRSAGQTVARVRELENVRSFLTGQGLSSFIDIAFTLVFLAVLFAYSSVLSIIVLAAIPVYIVIIFSVRPLLRERVRQRFNRGAESQQFLVEAVVGIATIKAAAVEPLMQRQWEERLAAYVKVAFQTGMLANLGQQAIQYVGRITTALILLFGALRVMDGRMTVGELIAFNMISGQLLAPVIRLSSLWQDFQQVQVSVERIADIYNAEPEEQPSSSGGLPLLEGCIRLENVTFRYQPGGPPVLSDVDLLIPPGQVIGVVGASGSGKSTLAKLVQRLYLPERGKVVVDGIDVVQAPPAWLRRQIGVVLQENLLFNRSIHENIAFATPAMARREVVKIARLAGADDFIQGLPHGYDTLIQERGANLSGGQRQRIAIARALARSPRILIFDEATSALDYESERVIRENMRSISAGRTVIVIAHRLAAVRDCDRIIGMERGRIVEDGSHDELLRRPSSLYARLWTLQNQV